MFITAVCVLFLIKLRWPKKKSIYERDIVLVTRRFPRFPKSFLNLSEGHTNIVEHFPTFSEDCRRLPKTFEENPEMFRLCTNEFKYNLRDKLDISEIDIFTSEDMRLLHGKCERTILIHELSSTVKPALDGHLRDPCKCPLNTGCPLKTGSLRIRLKKVINIRQYQKTLKGSNSILVNGQ